MEASTIRQSAPAAALVGRSPLLRLQSDERLIALVRRGHHGAFETLVQRYQGRLLAFCRHMLGSTEDAEDVLQEVFASAYNAIGADDRPINARPWLYRIARNRCLNHLRRPLPSGQDSMDVFERDGGATTADTVHKREEFRHVVADVQELPETQRTALLLREMDALSYDQIAEAMDTTVPSIKSLLVRARVSLAEAAEARLLTCEEVRLELGQVAEGLAKSTAPVRRHLKGCDRCRTFQRELRKTSKALAAVYPVGPLVALHKLVLAKLGTGAAAGGTATAGGSTVAGGTASAGGAVSASVTAIASKAAAGLVAAAVVTAGAVEVRQATEPRPAHHPRPAATAPLPAMPAPSAHPSPAGPPPPPSSAAAAPTRRPVRPAAPTANLAPTAQAEPTSRPATASSSSPASSSQSSPSASPPSSPPSSSPTATSAGAGTSDSSSGSRADKGDGASGHAANQQSGDASQDQGSSPPADSAGSDRTPSSPPGESTSAPKEHSTAPIAGEADHLP